MGRVAAECTKMTNARAERAKLFSLLNMQICDVLIAVAIRCVKSSCFVSIASVQHIMGVEKRSFERMLYMLTS